MSTSLSASAIQATNNVCQTAACVETSKSLLNYIDFNVDPCSDFYQYTCGTWLKSGSIPPDQSSDGLFPDTANIIAKVIHEILEGEYQDVYKNLKDGDAGFHTDDEQEVDKANFQAMKDYYNLCMDTDTLDELGPTPIYPEIAKIQNNIFPVNQDETYSSNQISQMTDILVYLSRTGTDTLIGSSVSAGLTNSNESAVFIRGPTLTLKSEKKYKKPETLQSFNTLLTELLTTIIGESACEGCNEASKSVGFQLWSKEKVQSAVNNFIAIETALVNITSTDEEEEDSQNTVNIVSLDSFQNEYALIDWASYLKGLMLPGTPLPETIINGAPIYYKGLNEFLSSGIKMESLQDYFVISYIYKFAKSLDSKSHAASIHLTGELLTGQIAEKARWRTCIDNASGMFDALLGRYYVLRAFGGEEEKNKAEDFVNIIHDSWRNRILATEWLDAETREKAMEKLNSIKHKVGYPTISPDEKNPLSLSKYYAGLKPNQTSYFDSEVKQNTWHKTLEWKQLGKPVDKNAWGLSPQTVNAYYNPSNNEILVPAGILQSIFYSNDSPDFLNYGSIGYVIGHEFSHGFDNNGRLFNGQGNIVDWWTNATSQEFVNRSQCFIDQYSKFNISDPEGEIYNVDGQLTLGENLADNGGIAVSFYAYQNLRLNSKKQEPRLPGLEQLSPEQLFFINFGRTWCTLQTDQSRIAQIYTDAHSLAEFRINGVVQNNVEFSKAFNCPVGSPMNPKTKCKIW